MIITGYQIMDRLEELKETARLADEQFTDALYRFAADADKPDPRNLLLAYQTAQEKIAKLQTAQSAYNLAVTVVVQGETMPLEYAVKLIGSTNRIKNQWTAAAQDKSARAAFGYGGTPRSRDKEHEYAERVVSAEECLRLAEIAGKRATALKQAIRSGNATEANLDLDLSVFE